MTHSSSDVLAVVRAVGALTTQVRRIADAVTTPVTRTDVAADDVRTTADDADAQRTARRISLRNLLGRAAAGLTPDEDALLRQHTEAEIREADTARAVARSNLRHVQTIVPEIDRLAAELEQAQAAIERVRAAAKWARHHHPGLRHVHDRLAAALADASDARHRELTTRTTA
ncbi:hypothetical protein GCM10018980_51390 [Streptomyces capoamus]|uniref:Uncharacterized protein n=1 Tax=Streptomyces capoamus TaxID=68183 RepID=A0A919EZ90_9ACTN|nr:hypothetical protein [Streptomyces capoamus]GGW15821.1 hypothetical protein GCM10010501_29420 [Streptomyces libani subsp. rufus]GHG61886.1 hypothetical protein GCM10018980_51390 [Streptomyces capoamus]